MSDTAFPEYVQHNGELSYPAPVVCEGVNLYGFILEGRHDNLEALCRRVFRDPSGGSVTYYPLTPYVMLTIGRIRKIYSSSLDVGWSPETQVIIWIPCAAVRQNGSILVAERLAFFPAYTIVGEIYSLVSGREVYGFFKSYGWVDVPESDDVINPPRLGLDVYGLKSFSPDSEAGRWPLLEVQRIGPGAAAETRHPHAGASAWNTLEEALHELKSVIAGTGKEIVIPGLELPANLIYDLIHKEVPLVFLKQFRNAGSDGGAAYQAIIEAPAVVQRFTGLRLMDEYQFNILNRLDSYPMADDLGLTSQKALLSFKLDMDFTVMQGKEVWNAAPRHGDAGSAQRRGCLGFLAGLFSLL